MGFFGGATPSSGGAIISRVTVKKAVPTKRPISSSGNGHSNGNTSSTSKSNGNHHSTSSPSTSTSSSTRPIVSSRPVASSSSSSSSSAPPRRADHPSSTPSRVAITPGPSQSSIPRRPALPKTASHVSSRSSTPLKKRRTPSPVRSESESSSGSDSDASSDGDRRATKRAKSDLANNGSGKVNGSGAGSGSRRKHAATPSKSSSTRGTPMSGMTPRTSISHGRSLWNLDKVDQRGEWGRGWGGFITCEEACRGDILGWSGGKGDGTGWLSRYTAYFPQEGFEAPSSASEPFPIVDVLYPARNCREKFVLLIPTKPREYNPIAELRATLRLILDHYIPPSHQAIFGTLSDSLTDLDSARTSISQPTLPPTSTSVAPSPLPAPGTAPSTPSIVVVSDPFATSQAAAIAASALEAPAEAVVEVNAGPKESIGTAIRRALASNRRDGPALIRAIERYNAAMEALQASGEMSAWLEQRARQLLSEEKVRGWDDIVERVNEMAYTRVVGPYSNELEHHPKHPEEVARAISAKEDAYGELRHSFMSRIIAQTDLGPDSVFVDLGSGVGNCVIQTALQTGCSSYGVELLPVPSHCARLQVAEAKRRWAMWGLNGNMDIELEEGDMRGNAKVAKWLAKADVVLVNNEVFPPSLNADLKNMFLDLKEGAKIVSLRPFVNEGFRMNESNCDSFDAIVKLTTHNYYNDWVSWKGDPGRYFVQTIDRSERIRFEEELMKGGARRRR